MIIERQETEYEQQAKSLETATTALQTKEAESSVLQQNAAKVKVKVGQKACLCLGDLNTDCTSGILVLVDHQVVVQDNTTR